MHLEGQRNTEKSTCNSYSRLLRNAPKIRVITVKKTTILSLCEK